MNDVDPRYMRVSEVLGRLRNRSYIHTAVLREKGDIGTEVHSNIHEDANDGMVLFKKYPIRNPRGEILVKDGEERWEERGKGYFESYLKWKSAVNPIYKIMETRYCCDDLMITGQIDAVVENNGGLYLVDYKCSYAPDHEIWEMQGHFYYYLLEKSGIKLAPLITFIQLKKDGAEPKLHRYEFSDKVLRRCIEEAVRAWEEKSMAKMLD